MKTVSLPVFSFELAFKIWVALMRKVRSKISCVTYLVSGQIISIDGRNKILRIFQTFKCLNLTDLLYSFITQEFLYRNETRIKLPNLICKWRLTMCFYKALRIKAGAILKTGSTQLTITTLLVLFWNRTRSCHTVSDI